MKKAALAAALLLFFLAGTLAAETPDNLDVYFTPAEQASMGLRKLTARQRKALGNWIRKKMELMDFLLRENSFLSRSHEYLKTEGWKEVLFIGRVRMKLDLDLFEREYYVFKDNIWTYILEPQTFALGLTRGKYLGEMGFVSCRIIGKNGRVISFWTKKTR